MVKPKSVKLIQTAKIGYIVMSAIFCVFGIFLIAAPEISIGLLGRIMGIMMIVFGTVKLIGYFPRTCSGWRFSMIWRSVFF